MTQVSVILLAGGSGQRMHSGIPKQYLPLQGKPIARHSFDLFASLPEVGEIVVVCAPEYQAIFGLESPTNIAVRFATPGAQRQDSTYSGLQQVSSQATLVCVHDAARPLLTKEAAQQVIAAAATHGAAALAVPAKATIKQGDHSQFVTCTLDRKSLWEMQTPQVIERNLLARAYAHCQENASALTDDVSLIEALGHPVKLVVGDDSNIKITTPADLAIAEALTGPRHYVRCGVYGIVVQDDRLLLVYKDPNGVDAGKLDLPGGGIEFAESPEEALRREFREEVGMQFASVTPWRNLSRMLDIVKAGRTFRCHHLGQLYQVSAVASIPDITCEPFIWMPINRLSECALTAFAGEVARSLVNKT